MTSEGLGFEHIQPSLDRSGELCIPSFCTSSPSSVQVSSRACHRSIQTSDSNCTLLDGGSLASHNFQHVERHSSLCFVRNCIRDVLVGQILKGML